MPLFFDARHLPDPVDEYVAWVDVMGTQESMSRSIRRTANFMFKLHTAALEAPAPHVRLYPVMDGFYASTGNKDSMLDFLRHVFVAVADEFNRERGIKRFMIRGGLAFGPTYHGRDVPSRASATLAHHSSYRDSLLLGLPMVQAHLGERLAPPFGVYVHESARSFAPAGMEPMHMSWWKWINLGSRGTWRNLQLQLEHHFRWCKEQSLAIGYAPERIARHEEMVKQYFAR